MYERANGCVNVCVDVCVCGELSSASDIATAAGPRDLWSGPGDQTSRFRRCWPGFYSRHSGEPLDRRRKPFCVPSLQHQQRDTLANIGSILFIPTQLIDRPDLGLWIERGRAPWPNANGDEAHTPLLIMPNRFSPCGSRLAHLTFFPCVFFALPDIIDSIPWIWTSVTHSHTHKHTHQEPVRPRWRIESSPRTWGPLSIYLSGLGRCFSRVFAGTPAERRPHPHRNKQTRTRV